MTLSAATRFAITHVTFASQHKGHLRQRTRCTPRSTYAKSVAEVMMDDNFKGLYAMEHDVDFTKAR